MATTATLNPTNPPSGRPSTATATATTTMTTKAGKPLQHSFVFWYMRRGKGGNTEAATPQQEAAAVEAEKEGGPPNPYESSIKRIARVETVTEFWQVYDWLTRPNELPTTTDLHFFRNDIKPTWEDPENAKGGKWLIRLKKGLASRYWEEVILAMVGQQFSGIPADEINGAVVSIRYAEDIISIWNKTAHEREYTEKIRDGIKKVLRLPPHVHMEYKPHQASLADKSSFRNTTVWKPKSLGGGGGPSANGGSVGSPQERTTPTSSGDHHSGMRYAQKDAEINEINATEENFTVGHNFMSTWTAAEYKRILGYAGQHLEGEAREVYLEPVNADSKDWRTEGAVNAVKNQAQCGSCWAFSATCAAEGAHFIKTGELLSLSEQELVSCSMIDLGCNGGLQSRAFFYLEHHEQELESDYPYTSGTGSSGKCKFDKTKGKVGIKTYTNVPAKSVEQLKAAIDKQPVAVTIEADKTVFQQYTSGIMDSTACGTSLDHAVAAVGYGTENGQEYYIVRNSWGATWGDQGYIKIAAV